MLTQYGILQIHLAEAAIIFSAALMLILRFVKDRVYIRVILFAFGNSFVYYSFGVRLPNEMYWLWLSTVIFYIASGAGLAGIPNIRESKPSSLERWFNRKSEGE